MKFFFRFLCFVVLATSIIVNIYLAINYHLLTSDVQKQFQNKVDKRHVAIVTDARTENDSSRANVTTIPSPELTDATNNNVFNWTSLSANELKYFGTLFGPSSVPLDKEQFTILTMTYKRPALLQILIPHYCSSGERLHKIVIVWNDIESDIPQYLREIKCEVVLEFIIAKENKLTNRFIPYSQIETEAVFCIDDDRKINHDDLRLAFQSWQQIRHKILGFERRTHTILSDGSYVYGEKEDTLAKLGYSIVLSTNFILHKAYFEMFQLEEFVPRGVTQYVDEKMNCEDFAMCIMVGDFLERVSSAQSCCFVVKGRNYPANLEEKNDPNGYQGLSKRGGRHYSERTKCLNDFRPFYKNGIIPLYYTQVKITHELRSYYRRKRLG